MKHYGFWSTAGESTRCSASRFFSIVVLAGFFVLGLGCQAERATTDGAKRSSDVQAARSSPIVFVSNPFLNEAVRSIAGTRVERLYLLPANQDPTTWKPTTADLEKMQQARLLVLNGAEFEPWVAGVALPSSRMLRTANQFLDQWIKTKEVVHSHGPGGEHSHAGIACTTWLDFELAKQQANAVRERLVQLFPEAAEEFTKGFGEFSSQLRELDQRMQELATKLGQRPLLVSHPFHQYWARRYGLNVRAVNWDAMMPPGAKELEELQQALIDFPAETFLWESTPAESSVALLRERGITSAVFTPAANLPEQDSWLDVMKQNIGNIEQLVK